MLGRKQIRGGGLCLIQGGDYMLEGTKGTFGIGTVQKIGVRYVSLCSKPHCIRPFAKRPFAKCSLVPSEYDGSPHSHYGHALLLIRIPGFRKPGFGEHGVFKGERNTRTVQVWDPAHRPLGNKSQEILAFL